MLSVTHEGFSLDRDMGEGVTDQWPMLVVPMQKVHSWVSVAGHFALRHHHGASGGSVQVNTFEMKKSKDLDNLMRAVDDAVAAYKERSESALAARAIEDADFASLVSSLEAMETPSRVQHMKTSLSGGGGPASGGSRTLSSDQAQTLMQLVVEGFDAIEAACFLHGVCIEHAGKTALLDALGAEDRETAVARVRAAAGK